MHISIMLRGTLQDLDDPKSLDKEKEYTVHEGCTCADALLYAGIDYSQRKDFGFVAINDMRVSIDQKLHDGDVLKAFSTLDGG